MAKTSRLSLYKQRFSLTVDLLALRLKMARLEWQDYQSGWSALLLAGLLSASCILLSGLSLLFALQAALPDEKAVRMFGMMCILFLIAFAGLTAYIIVIRRRQKNFLRETLDGLSADIELLRGERPSEEQSEQNENSAHRT